MFIFRSILRPDMAFRLSAESEGQPVFNVDTSQEKFDKKKFEALVIENLTQGRPVAFSIRAIKNSSPGEVALYLGGELYTRLENAGFDPMIEIVNYPNEEGVTNESIVLIKP